MKKKLKMLKGAFLVSYIFLAVISYYYSLIAAIVALVIIAFLQEKFFSCSACHKGLDIRINLNETDYCPYCGEALK